MIKVIAIDDEPLALQQLVAYIKKVPFLQLVGTCQNAIQAKETLNREAVDAIFCDINMPDLNGMDFVKSLAAPPLVVFTTAYADYAVEGYKVDAVDYLLKPFGLDDFKRAANKLVKRMGEQPQLATPSTAAAPSPTGAPANTTTASAPKTSNNKANNVAADDGSLFVKTDGRIVKIAVEDISYIEGMSEYLKIHLDSTTPDGHKPKPLVVLFAMKKMEERLPSYFMRIHRSYIINLKKIKEVNKNRVILDRDTFLPIGDLYKEAFQNFLSRNFLGK
ncbi:MAG: LytR/AlgR family response regulator transcription factor [Prevotella sp.]|jgi:two-component system LytT family response regulator